MKNAKNTNVLIVATFLTLSFNLNSVLAAPLCEHLFSDSMALKPLPRDLYDHQYYEVQGKSEADIAALNKKTLDDLMAYTPDQRNPNRSHSITFREANAIHQSIYENKAAHPSKTGEYEKKGAGIGYCFGRSMYYHLMFLKKGLQKESIKKIWAVGLMKTATVNWGFHVATMVYTRDNGWMVIDSNHHDPISVERWMENYSKYSPKKDLRFYISSPEKFSVNTGKYERSQLGLDISRDVDWFQHYFKDMMTDEVQFKTEYSKLIQIKPANKVTEAEKFSVKSMLKHIADFVRSKK